MQVIETPVAGEVRHYQMLIGGEWVDAQSGPLCCKNAGRKKMDVKTPKLLCLDGYSKQFSNECCLAWRLSFLHPSHLSFPDHVPDLISLSGSPGRFKRKEAQSRLDQPF